MFELSNPYQTTKQSMIQHNKTEETALK